MQWFVNNWPTITWTITFVAVGCLPIVMCMQTWEARKAVTTVQTVLVVFQIIGLVFYFIFK